MKSFLLELGMEEIPSRFIPDAVEQLREKTGKWLKENRLSFDSVTAYATPRRIAVHVTGLPEKQEDISEEIKGPARKIAVDEEGNWTRAALGFAGSQGVAPEDLIFREWKGTEYVYAVKSSAGRKTMELLREELEQLITSLHFPKNMRWANHDLKFVRPIRWIVALFGEEVIPVEVAGVTSGKRSKGHRFLGDEAVIDSPEVYLERLRDQFVIADIEERKQRIVEQIDTLAREKGWVISVKEDLLEEVLYLVEYPTVLYGGFDSAFLEIPQEVLITSMREHQRYFPVLDADGKLLPWFVTVRNGDDRSLETVAKGNEKVLRARLADARFFYREDLKLSIDEAMTRLETIVFHEELGTLGDKARRIRALSDQLARQIGMNDEAIRHVSRTASICKFDLVTQMVYEFPELQGVMGEDYARRAGEPEEVARGIFEHYRPRFSGDGIPASSIGSVVSIADKIDTICGCFSIGIVPTGSQDPYALRRQAAGIVQILHEHNLPIRLTTLFEAALSVLEQNVGLKRKKTEIVEDLSEFFALRVKNLLSEQVRYDLVDAVMSAGFDHIASVTRRAEALKRFVSEDRNKSVLESFNRVNNLAAKAESDEIKESVFQDESEKQLYETWVRLHAEYEKQIREEQEDRALETLGRLESDITAYFERVMVMAEDPEIRRNRLALLKNISQDFRAFADFQKIVWS